MSPSLHIESAGQNTVGVGSDECTLFHHLPNGEQVGAYVGGATPGQFIVPDDIGNGPGIVHAPALEVGAAVDGVGELHCAGQVFFAFFHDEAAADGVIGLAFAGSIAVKGVENQAVGMIWQARFEVKLNLLVGIEGDRVAAADPDFLVEANSVEGGLHLIYRDADGVVAIEAEDNGQVGAVAFAGFGEGAVELDPDFRELAQSAFFGDFPDEALGGAPGAHRMRARRADPDLKNIEDADSFHDDRAGRLFGGGKVGKREL